jgi:hypothetical protein
MWKNVDTSSALSLNRRHQTAAAAMVSMFAQINALPGAQVQPAVGDGNGQGGAQDAAL